MPIRFKRISCLWGSQAPENQKQAVRERAIANFIDKRIILRKQDMPFLQTLINGGGKVWNNVQEPLFLGLDRHIIHYFLIPLQLNSVQTLDYK